MKKLVDELISRLETEPCTSIYEERALEKVILLAREVAKEHEHSACNWWLHDEEANVYETTCRNFHIFTVGGPEDNHYDFCPYCGNEINEVER